MTIAYPIGSAISGAYPDSDCPRAASAGAFPGTGEWPFCAPNYASFSADSLTRQSPVKEPYNNVQQAQHEICTEEVCQAFA